MAFPPTGVLGEAAGGGAGAACATPLARLRGAAGAAGPAFLGMAPQTATTADDVTIMHVHNAGRGTNGPVVFGQIGPAQDGDDLRIVLNADGPWTVSGVWEATDPANRPIADFAE